MHTQIYTHTHIYTQIYTYTTLMYRQMNTKANAQHTHSLLCREREREIKRDVITHTLHRTQTHAHTFIYKERKKGKKREHERREYGKREGDTECERKRWGCIV